MRSADNGNGRYDIVNTCITAFNNRYCLTTEIHHYRVSRDTEYVELVGK